MFDFTPNQMINCAQHNQRKLEGMGEILSESMYALDPEFNETMAEARALLEKLRLASKRHEMDAQITYYTDLRNSIPE